MQYSRLPAEKIVCCTCRTLTSSSPMKNVEVRMIWVTMFPRFVKTCCKDHEEVWLLDGLRRDVNRKSKNGLVEKRPNVEVFFNKTVSFILEIQCIYNMYYVIWYKG
jgi:hypothetical protein